MVYFVLCLIIDKFPHAVAWQAWAARHAPVQFLFHAKYPARVSDPWVAERLITEHYTPAWGSLDIVRAQLALLRAGLSHSCCDMVMFASESCMPVLHVPPPCTTTLMPDIPRHREDHVNARGVPDAAKCSQWVALSRAHAFIVLNTTAVAEFAHMRAPDEWFVATVLVRAGIVDMSALYAHAHAAALAEDASALYGVSKPFVVTAAPCPSAPGEDVHFADMTYARWCRGQKSPAWLVDPAEIAAIMETGRYVCIRKIASSSSSLSS